LKKLILHIGTVSNLAADRVVQASPLQITQHGLPLAIGFEDELEIQKTSHPQDYPFLIELRDEPKVTFTDHAFINLESKKFVAG